MKKIKISLLALFVFDLLIKQMLYWLFPEKISANTGISFGLPAPTKFVPFLLLGFLVLSINYAQNKSVNIGLLAIFLGGFSNYIDRLLSGGVIDYLKPLPGFLIFNLSDVMIVGGLIYLFSLWLKQNRANSKQ